MRLLDAADRLVQELELERDYPADFIEWRLTGWRRDDIDPGVVVSGVVLLADLVTLAQRVSRRVPQPADGSGDLMLLPEVAQSLGVSQRTLVRRRRMGLMMRYVVCDDGEHRLACRRSMFEWFERRCPASDTTPSSVSSKTIIEAASKHPGLALSDLARAVAARIPTRSTESVRGVLRRAAARGALVIPRQRRLSAFERRFGVRCWRKGIPTSKIAARLGVSVPSLHRTLAAAKRGRITNILASLPAEEPPLDLGPELLAGEAVRSGLPAWACRFRFLEDDSADIAASGRDLHAMELLRARMRTTDLGSAAGLDRVQTDLLWHTRLLWRQMLTMQTIVLQSVTLWSQVPVTTIPPTLQQRLLMRLIPTLRLAVLGQRHAEADRLQARVHAAIDMELARLPAFGAACDAQSEACDCGIELIHVDPWGDVLPDPRWLQRIERLTDRQQRLMIMRWGVSGDVPYTIEEIAACELGDPRALARTMASARQRLACEGR